MLNVAPIAALWDEHPSAPELCIRGESLQCGNVTHATPAYAMAYSSDGLYSAPEEVKPNPNPNPNSNPNPRGGSTFPLRRPGGVGVCKMAIGARDSRAANAGSPYTLTLTLTLTLTRHPGVVILTMTVTIALTPPPDPFQRLQLNRSPLSPTNA